MEVRDRHPIRLEFPPRDSRVRKRRPSSSIAIPRARIAFGVVARASPPLSSSLAARPALTPPSARRPPPDRLAQVHAGETVRELCDRVLVNPFDPSSRGASNLPEVTWANTLIPLEEQIDQLTVTKPWQLNLKGGEEVLTMTVPSGVGVRDAPEPPEERATPEEARSKSSRGAKEEEAGEKSALEGKKFTIRDVRGTSSDEASPEEKARLAAEEAERAEKAAVPPGGRARRERSKPMRLVDSIEGPQWARKSTSPDSRDDDASRRKKLKRPRGGASASKSASRSSPSEPAGARAQASDDTPSDPDPTRAGGSPAEDDDDDAAAAAAAAADEEGEDPLTEAAAVGLLAVASGEQRRPADAPGAMPLLSESMVAVAAQLPRVTKVTSRGKSSAPPRIGNKKHKRAPPPPPPASADPARLLDLNISPALLAAFHAGQRAGPGAVDIAPYLAAAGGFQSGAAGASASAGAGPGAVPPFAASPVADIIAKYYKHKPPEQGASRGKDPLESFRNLGAAKEGGGGGSIGAQGGAQGGHASGSDADARALLQWRETQARLAAAGRYGAAPGAFVVDPANLGRFQTPASREVLEETRRNNELEIVKLTATMEQLRRVVRALDADVPAHMRMVIISRVQRLLQGISDTVPRLSASERAPLLAAVAEVWAWVKAQLSERLDEALALVQESESDRGGDAIKEEKAASRARRQDGDDDDDDGGDGDGGDGDGVGGGTTIGAGETDPAEP